MSDPGSSWTLSAQVSPAQEAAPAVSADDSLGVRREWAKASSEVRATVKWLITALAAVGALLFAKGVVSTPALSWTDNRAQLVWALVCGVVALLGIGTLITMAVRVLRPTMYTLDDLPRTFRELVDRNATDYLPTSSPTLAEFTRRYRSAQRGVFTSEQRLRQLGRAAAAARAAATAAPNDTALLAAAQAAEASLGSAADGQQVLVHNWAVHRQAKESLLERAEYHAQISGLSRGWLVALVGAGVAAALGGVGYVLALSSPAEATDGPSTPSRPVIGELIRLDTPAAARLWKALDLSSCQEDPGTARIAVVVASGVGSVDDPFTVTTLPTATCRATTFPVLHEVATVVRPVGLTITYTPAPTSSPSRLTPKGAPTLSP